MLITQLVSSLGQSHDLFETNKHLDFLTNIGLIKADALTTTLATNSSGRKIAVCQNVIPVLHPQLAGRPGDGISSVDHSNAIINERLITKQVPGVQLSASGVMEQRSSDPVDPEVVSDISGDIEFDSLDLAAYFDEFDLSAYSDGNDFDLSAYSDGNDVVDPEKLHDKNQPNDPGSFFEGSKPAIIACKDDADRQINKSNSLNSPNDDNNQGLLEKSILEALVQGESGKLEILYRDDVSVRVVFDNEFFGKIFGVFFLNSNDEAKCPDEINYLKGSDCGSGIGYLFHRSFTVNKCWGYFKKSQDDFAGHSNDSDLQLSRENATVCQKANLADNQDERCLENFYYKVNYKKSKFLYERVANGDSDCTGSRKGRKSDSKSCKRSGVNSGNNFFSCNFCEKTYSSRSSRNRHQRGNHQNMYLYRCALPNCTFGAMEKQQIQRHCISHVKQIERRAAFARQWEKIVTAQNPLATT